MDNQLTKIQKEIDAIKKRNKRVEADKAWEVSWLRKVLIALLTYFVIVVFMLVLDFEKPYISALVPSAAYLISMSTLSVFKGWWIKQSIK